MHHEFVVAFVFYFFFSLFIRRNVFLFFICCDVGVGHEWNIISLYFGPLQICYLPGDWFVHCLWKFTNESMNGRRIDYINLSNNNALDWTGPKSKSISTIAVQKIRNAPAEMKTKNLIQNQMQKLKKRRETNKTDQVINIEKIIINEEMRIEHCITISWLSISGQVFQIEMDSTHSTTYIQMAVKEK